MLVIGKLVFWRLHQFKPVTSKLINSYDELKHVYWFGNEAGSTKAIGNNEVPLDARRSQFH